MMKYSSSLCDVSKSRLKAGHVVYDSERHRSIFITEVRDLLFDTVVKYLEVLLSEPGHKPAERVHDCHGHAHEPRLKLNLIVGLRFPLLRPRQPWIRNERYE